MRRLNRTPAPATRAERRRAEREASVELAALTSLHMVGGRSIRIFDGHEQTVMRWAPEWLEVVGAFPDPDTWAAWTPPNDPTGRFGWESANHVGVVWWPVDGSDVERRTSVYLTLKRLDKAPMGDWRVKQRIKNALLGDEAEAVELYPAESRLIDESNQYHLFCCLPPERFPVGFTNRAVTDGDGLSMRGMHRQRPLSDQGGPL